MNLKQLLNSLRQAGEDVEFTADLGLLAEEVRTVTLRHRRNGTAFTVLLAGTPDTRGHTETQGVAVAMSDREARRALHAALAALNREVRHKLLLAAVVGDDPDGAAGLLYTCFDRAGLNPGLWCDTHSGCDPSQLQSFFSDLTRAGSSGAVLALTPTDLAAATRVGFDFDLVLPVRPPYGAARRLNLRQRPGPQPVWGQRVELAGPLLGRRTVVAVLGTPGPLARRDALVAATGALRLGLSHEAVESALNAYPGAYRHLQLLLDGPLRIVDDRAATPARVVAVAAAVAEAQLARPGPPCHRLQPVLDDPTLAGPLARALRHHGFGRQAVPPLCVSGDPETALEAALMAAAEGDLMLLLGGRTLTRGQAALNRVLARHPAFAPDEPYDELGPGPFLRPEPTSFTLPTALPVR